MEELALYILDLVQNSIEAGADRVCVFLDQCAADGKIVIEVRDNGRGMDEAARAAAFDPFYTTRTTRRLGLGLALLRAAAEATRGWVELESQVGAGTRVKAVFDASHIDCPPLGDVPTTLAVILAANPDLELCYRHRFGDREFSFTSSELRARLGEVALNDPTVFQCLRELFAESLDNLHGGVNP